MSFAGRKQCPCRRFQSFLNPKDPVRKWVVVQRKQNRNSYTVRPSTTTSDGLSLTPEKSNWSHVLCLTCGAHWRTQAGYVNRLPDISEEGQRLCLGRLRQERPASDELLYKLDPDRRPPLFGGPIKSSSRSGARKIRSSAARRKR